MPFFCFLTGGNCPADASPLTRSQWTEKQGLMQGTFKSTDLKRFREEGDTGSQNAKRLRLQGEYDENDPPL
jgi:hypothetical protein